MMPSDPELFEGAAPVRKRRKPRDYIFEGLCVACNKNPKALCRYDRGQLNAAVRQLKEKGVLNDLDGKRMIVARAKKWATLYGYKGPLANPMQLVKDWDGCGKIGVVKTIQPGHPSRTEQAERRKWDAAWAWWKGLSLAERDKRRGGHPPRALDAVVIVAEFDRANRPGSRSDDGQETLDPLQAL